MITRHLLLIAFLFYNPFNFNGLIIAFAFIAMAVDLMLDLLAYIVKEK
jgi:hypothetical protein